MVKITATNAEEGKMSEKPACILAAYKCGYKVCATTYRDTKDGNIVWYHYLCSMTAQSHGRKVHLTKCKDIKRCPLEEK